MDLSSLGKGAVKTVEFRSTITPAYKYNPWGAKTDAPPSPIMKLLKPTVVLDTVAGPVTLAPYGEPKRNLFPVIVVAGVLLVVGTVYAISYVARRTAK